MEADSTGSLFIGPRVVEALFAVAIVANLSHHRVGGILLPVGRLGRVGRGRVVARRARDESSDGGLDWCVVHVSDSTPTGAATQIHVQHMDRLDKQARGLYNLGARSAHMHRSPPKIFQHLQKFDFVPNKFFQLLSKTIIVFVAMLCTLPGIFRPPLVQWLGHTILFHVGRARQVLGQGS